jgi:hypothetical protein
MRIRTRRQAAGTGGTQRPGDRVRGAAGSRSGGGALRWLRNPIVLFWVMFGGALVAILLTWYEGLFDSVLRNAIPSGQETFCSLRETADYYWPFSRPHSRNRFTILVARLDNDDAKGIYTRSVAGAFSNRDGIEASETCHVVRLSEAGPSAKVAAVATARRWLEQRHADLLVGGEVLKKQEAVYLWFIAKATGTGFQESPFRLDARMLGDGLREAKSAELVGIALASIGPEAMENGRSLVGILKPIAKNLRALLDASTGLTLGQSADLQYALGKRYR